MSLPGPAYLTVEVPEDLAVPEKGIIIQDDYTLQDNLICQNVLCVKEISGE